MRNQNIFFQDWNALTSYLESKGHFRMDLSFIRIEKTLRSLNLTRPPFIFVQIVGTNGKGSTCTFLSQMLAEQGIPVGLHTSPHLFSLQERILLQNQQLSTTVWVDAANELALHGGLELTYFEFVTCLAVLIFAKNNVHVAIMETGLGGTFDATSAFTADVIAFTPIDFDHMSILGNTLKEIAEDKAGAIRAKTPVLSVIQHQDVATILEKKALEQKTTVLYCHPQMANSMESKPFCATPTHCSIPIVWDFCPKNRLPELGLAGEHQYTNAALATALFRLIAHPSKTQLTDVQAEKESILAHTPQNLHPQSLSIRKKAIPTLSPLVQQPTNISFPFSPEKEKLCAIIQQTWQPKAEQQGLQRAHIAGRMQHTEYIPPKNNSAKHGTLGNTPLSFSATPCAITPCAEFASATPCAATPCVDSSSTTPCGITPCVNSCNAHFPYGLPPMILDGAHNSSGLAALGLALAKQKTAPLATIFSCLHDKDTQALIAHVRAMSPGRIFVPPITNNPRASNPQKLAQEIGINALACTSLQEAFMLSIQHMHERMPEVFSQTPTLNPLLVCGSLYLLGDVFSLFPFLLEQNI